MENIPAFKIDHRFAVEYCEAHECPYLFSYSTRKKIPRKRLSYFCKKPELLRQHLQEHFENGGRGSAKLLRGDEEAYALESQARYFLELGRAELVSEKPLIIRFKAPAP